MNPQDKVIEAQQAWEDKANKIMNLLPCASANCGMHESLSEQQIIKLLSDYKQALKKEIEKEEVSRGIFGHYTDGRTWAFEKVLELLDTVKPL